MARGTGVLPVSVLVSPRLFDADRLREFPDWLDWTARLADRRAGADASGPTVARSPAPCRRAPLRPDLWRAMFNDETYVRSHTFADHSERAILSWPMRFALSTLKSMYQRAGVDLALPDRRPPIRGEEQESAHRRLVRELVDGLAVGWDDERGERLRSYYRDLFGSPTGTFFPFHYQPGDIGSRRTPPAHAAGRRQPLLPPADDRAVRRREPRAPGRAHRRQPARLRDPDRLPPGAQLPQLVSRAAARPRPGDRPRPPGRLLRPRRRHPPARSA